MRSESTGQRDKNEKKKEWPEAKVDNGKIKGVESKRKNLLTLVKTGVIRCNGNINFMIKTTQNIV